MPSNQGRILLMVGVGKANGEDWTGLEVEAVK